MQFIKGVSTWFNITCPWWKLYNLNTELLATWISCCFQIVHLVLAFGKHFTQVDVYCQHDFRGGTQCKTSDLLCQSWIWLFDLRLDFLISVSHLKHVSLTQFSNVRPGFRFGPSFQTSDLICPSPTRGFDFGHHSLISDSISMQF